MDPFLDLLAGQYVVLSWIKVYICSYSACALASIISCDFLLVT
jgi:hypothetical protein